MGLRQEEELLPILYHGDDFESLWQLSTPVSLHHDAELFVCCNNFLVHLFDTKVCSLAISFCHRVHFITILEVSSTHLLHDKVSKAPAFACGLC